jgi:hypothetical protein
MRSTHGSGAYGEFDPWAYKAPHAAPLEVRTEHSSGHAVSRAAPLEVRTEHSSGQAVSRRPIVTVLQTVPIAGDANGLDWEDAGIGAVTAVGAISFVLGAAVVRRQRKIATAG